MKLLLTIIFSLTTIIVYSQTNTFPASGNVGIGTTTPTMALEIERSALSNGAEKFMKLNVSDAVGDELTIENATGGNGQFIPIIRGIRATDNRYALMISGNLVNAEQDAGNTAVVAFDARLTGGKINSRPLFVWQSYTTDYMTLSSSGNLGIGTSSPSEKLAVNGNIRAKEIKVETTNWPDYVFEEDYKMKSLTEIEAFIKTNKHLPGIPSQKQVEEEGVNLGEMNRKLLEKVEELTLILIQKDKIQTLQSEKISDQEERIKALEKLSNTKN